jgi:hypothetical protein
MGSGASLPDAKPAKWTIEDVQLASEMFLYRECYTITISHNFPFPKR